MDVGELLERVDEEALPVLARTRSAHPMIWRSPLFGARILAFFVVGLAYGLAKSWGRLCCEEP